MKLNDKTLLESLGPAFLVDKETYNFEIRDDENGIGPFGSWLIDHNIQFRDDDGVEFYIENKNKYPQIEEKTDYLTILIQKGKLEIGFFNEGVSISTSTEVDKMEFKCMMDHLEHRPYLKYVGYIGDRKIINGTYYYVEGNYMHGF